MNTQLIQRQYDEVIAHHYDLDPQSVLGSSLDRAAQQIRNQGLLDNRGSPFRVLDVGLGTGNFLSQLKRQGGEEVIPFGVDLSAKMVEIACERVPDLTAAVGDAADLDVHFPGDSFDLICTHFVTGYVPMSVLAPKIHTRLASGGCWSLVAGTKAGFPCLQKKANEKLVRWLYGKDKAVVDDIVCNPAGHDEVVQTLAANRFTILACETFTPRIMFGNYKQFMEFAYQGGWLTPFVESVGLHKAGFFSRLMLNWFAFPIEDHHSIEIVLAQKN